jgi:signal transduction histidine kinase
MANVIDDILQLAETESLGAEYVHVAMAGVIEETVKSVDTIAAEQGITIVGDDIVDAVVAGNREQLVSAVTNLLHNAITYTAVKGEPGLVRYRSYRSGPMVCIEVEDTGIGIPDRYQDRVFERFFRVDRARSRASGGTGLGLSIVRNIARAHGGNASLRSKVGVGSVFTVSLPVVGDDPS